MTVHPESKGLKDAVVAIEGIDNASQNDQTTPSTMLMNTGCAFSPHVIPLRAGGSLDIHNEDPILHNTHIKSKSRTLLNVAQPANGRPIVKTVKQAGLYHVQCDAHKFMRGYVMAFEHAYFAVSDEHGRARIPHVPPGPHQISVWHETLGRMYAKITVLANGEATLTIEFPDGGTPSRSTPEQ